jgi:HAD superfamily hydrolase (TIGR01484 family)
MGVDKRSGPPIRLVALDLDGTILDSGRTISDQVLTALADLRARGVTCVTATGRPFDFQIELLERHGIGPAAGCFQALIADERELFLLDRHHAHQQDSAVAYRPHRQWNDAIRVRWSRLLDEAVDWLESARAEAARRGWEAVMYPRNQIAERGLATLDLRHPERATAIRAWLSERLSASQAELVCNRNVRLVQVIDRAAGKGNLLTTLTKLWDLAPSQVLAIGDSSNDQPMLDGTFGFRAATPANADHDIKAAVRRQGGYVARSPAGAGVVEALNALVHAPAHGRAHD